MLRRDFGTFLRIMTSSSGVTLSGGHLMHGGRKQLILDRLSELPTGDAESATLAAMSGQNQPAFPSMADLAQQAHPLSAAAAAAGFALLPHHQQHHLQSTSPHHGLIGPGSAFSHPHYPPSHNSATAQHHPLLRRPVPLPFSTSLHAQINPSAGPSVSSAHQHLLSQSQQLQHQLAGIQSNCDRPPTAASPLSPGSSSATMSPSPSSKASSPASSANASGSGQVSRRTPLCSRCSNHGLKNPKKDHPPFCEYRFCTCPSCESIAERQDVMAKQISDRRSKKNAAASAAAASSGQTLNEDSLGKLPHAAKRRLSDEERKELFPRFIQYMGGHLDWTYFLMYVTLFRKIGDFKEFDAELRKAEREMDVLESEAKSCEIALSINVPIKPIPTRHHVPPVSATAPVSAASVSPLAANSGMKDLPGLPFGSNNPLLDPSSVTHSLIASRMSP